jgi:hypothetical protein
MANIHKNNSSSIGEAIKSGLTRVGLFSVAATATYCLLKPKEDPGTNQNLFPLYPRISKAHIHDTDKFSSHQWLKYSLVDHSDHKKQAVEASGIQIDGHNINIICAAHLLQLKKHAKSVGLEIRTFGETLYNPTLYVALEGTTPEAQAWLNKNSSDYGFAQALLETGEKVGNLFKFAPFSDTQLGSEIIALSDIYSRVLMAKSIGASPVTITPEEFNQHHADLVGLAIIPEIKGNSVSLSFNFDKIKGIYAELTNCGAQSYLLRENKGTLYGTLLREYPGVNNSEKFQKIIEATTALNEILFKLDPKKLHAGMLVAIPDLTCLSYAKTKQSELATDLDLNEKPKDRTEEDYFLTQDLLQRCQETAEKYQIIGREFHTGIVTHVLEGGRKGTEAIARNYGDAGGASYGRCQLSSTKGSLQNFVKFCKSKLKFQSIGSELERGGGLKSGNMPISFDQHWMRACKADINLFQKAESDFIQETILEPALKRANMHKFVPTQYLAIKSFIFSLATQFGLPDTKKNPDPLKSDHKFDEICRVAGKLGADCSVSKILDALIRKRTEVILRMASYLEDKPGNKREKRDNIQQAALFRSIAKNRYRDERFLLIWLDYQDIKKGNQPSLSL